MIGPEVKSALRVLADPRLAPFYPYPLEKLVLERKITSQGRQLDVGNRTADQAIREMPGGGESKLWMAINLSELASRRRTATSRFTKRTGAY
jgi:hypothetical protein